MSGTSTIPIALSLYDDTGNLVLAKQNVYNYLLYDYDILGRPSAKTTNRDTVKYTYNSKGALAAVTSAYNATTENYDYDFAGRLTFSKIVDEDKDIKGDPSDSLSQYDANFCIVQKNHYTYDALDRVKTVKHYVSNGKYGSGYSEDVTRTEYTYNSDGQLTAQNVYSEETGSIYLVPKITYTYDPLGLLNAITYVPSNGAGITNSITRSINYLTNAKGEKTTLVSSYALSIYNSTRTYNYTYDANGNITSETGYVFGNRSYTYDKLNQLKTASYGVLDYGRAVESFNYDTNGNITSRNNTTTWNYGGASDTTYTYTYDSTWTDRLLTVKRNGTTIRNYTYGLYGEGTPNTDGVFEYEWDGGNLVAATRISDNVRYEFKYNDNNQRISKSYKYTDDTPYMYDHIVTTKYFYSGDDLVREIKLDSYNGETHTLNQYEYVYDAGGLAYILFTDYEGKHYTAGTTQKFLVDRNMQGDVLALYRQESDGTYTKDVDYVYSAYGESTCENYGDISGFGNVNPMRYRSYYYDTDLGLYYLGSRYYDATVGRFISGDSYVSTGQGIIGYNMFAYCGNNPVNRVDPTGEFWIAALVLAVVAVVTLSSCAAKSTNSPRVDLATAPDLDVNTAPPTSYNCYGNGIGKQIDTNPTGYTKGDSTRKTFEAVINDLGSNNVRELNSINDPIGDDEFKVALKCGTKDYHFIRLTENGWYNKSGGVYSGLYVNQTQVEQDDWMAMAIINGEYYEGPPYYTYETIYFAVKLGWDVQ